MVLCSASMLLPVLLLASRGLCSASVMQPRGRPTLRMNTAGSPVALSACVDAVRPQQLRAHRGTARRAMHTGARCVRMQADTASNSTGEAEGELSAELQREIAIRPQNSNSNSRVWGLKLKGERQHSHSDGRDDLPYTLSCVGPPLVELGTFPLDPLTHNGDTLYVNDRKYKVKQITYIYKYVSGRYQMTAKAAACKEQSRITTEEALRRMWESDSTPVPPSDLV
ncbi:hypothetical protein T492DRAFT_972900 [Pavlovales sp. CCMP2436]|nr:hypothetical protein T492DRAFT_972900 [Pavlovales sp. CCMP2436]|mmetsp:Transcript_14831/g.37508  ORF Transcript_14831/g.37508 Transcript_14831/m.37508 type:complete len:225 (+) Transcript_14831:67-741(+)